MAKIGNETKLILKLAEEKMAGFFKLPEGVSEDERIKTHYMVEGALAYQKMLDRIVSDLESK